MGKTNSVICYITANTSQDILDLRKSLYLLDLNFNKQYRYPIVIFHEGLTEEVKTHLQAFSAVVLQFEQIELKVPEFLDISKIPKNMMGEGLGYRNQIRFCSYPMFQHSAIASRKWYWKMDSDSFLIKPMNFDPFVMAEENGYTYLYQAILPEPIFACVNFSEFVKNYIISNNMHVKYYGDFLDKDYNWYKNKYFYNDFEICKVSFRHSDSYTKWFNTIDKAGLIYTNRIGDTLISTMGLLFELEEKEFFCVDKIMGLNHQSFTTTYGRQF